MAIELTQLQKEVLRAELMKFFSTGEAQKCEYANYGAGVITFRYQLPGTKVIFFTFDYSEGWEPPMSGEKVAQTIPLKVEIEGLFEEKLLVEYEPGATTKTLIEVVRNIPGEIKRAREEREKELIKSAMNEFKNALTGVVREGMEVDNIRPKKRNFTGAGS